MTMMNEAGTFTITMRKRPWWQWVLATVWFLLEVLLLQTALASMKEEEYRAATICWIAVVVLAIAGALVCLRQGRSRRPDESSRPH
jgi:hypothetical protein